LFHAFHDKVNTVAIGPFERFQPEKQSILLARSLFRWDTVIAGRSIHPILISLRASTEGGFINDSNAGDFLEEVDDLFGVAIVRSNNR
jgi:hypothetical protein